MRIYLGVLLKPNVMAKCKSKKKTGSLDEIIAWW